MPFNSIHYLVFFLIAFCGSWLLMRTPAIRVLFLVLASFYFYASNNGWLFLLLLFSLQIDYVAARAMERSSSPIARRRWLITALFLQLSLLAYFKYTNFLLDSFRTVAEAAGYTFPALTMNIALPLGISFYTFQSMSYTIDVYRGRIPAEKSWLRFAFFLSYFPHLIAGPILRPGVMLPQLERRPRLDVSDVEYGLFRIMQGLFKKLVLGDYLIFFAERGFDQLPTASVMDTWLALYAFAFQIYFDFSGYSDIAIGCSKLLGFDIPENFMRPYVATGFSDFWRRWHISLSTWLREYLYIPLGGNRMNSNRAVYRNLMITMLLGGLWHGAAWHFVLWGFLHGAYLIGERMLKHSKPGSLSVSPSLPRRGIGRKLLIFHLVLLSWIPFRVSNAADIPLFVKHLFFSEHAGTLTLGAAIAMIIIVAGWCTQLLCEKRNWGEKFLELPLLMRAEAYAIVVMFVTIFSGAGYRQFIYFEF